MTNNNHYDWCNGCAIPLNERVTLPEGWKSGDEIPADATRHSTMREPHQFVFAHDGRTRVYLDGKSA